MWGFIVMIPFLGTSLGAAIVFFMKSRRNLAVEKALLGFASGVMIAASIWSLLQPAIVMAKEQGKISFLPAVVGILSGILFLFFLDIIISYLRTEHQKLEKNKLEKVKMLCFAVTLHNIPEGMAVGVLLASTKMQGTEIIITEALALSIGIAIQNIPEGAIISMPWKGLGASRKRAFSYGVLSGIVEPMSAVVTMILASCLVLILPYFLSFAAGAMFYVVVEELMTEMQNGEYRGLGKIGMLVGFLLMMMLDVALG